MAHPGVARLRPLDLSRPTAPITVRRISRWIERARGAVDSRVIATALAVGSAIAAWVTLLSTGLVTHHWWAWFAAPAYTAAAVVFAGLPSRWWSRLHLVVGALIVAVLIVPVATLAVFRSHSPAGYFAQSDTAAVEAAAVTAGDGHSPYAGLESGADGEIAPTGIDSYLSVTRDHFVYLPAMAIFGLPRAVGLPGLLGDARLWMLIATFICAWMVYRSVPDPRAKLAVLAVLASPLLAISLVVGNTDAVVVSLLVLGLVLCRHNDRRATMAFGIALALKQTAILVPVVLVLSNAHIAGMARRWFVTRVLAIGMPLTLAFLIWDRRDFLDDVVRFPLTRNGQDLAQLPPGVAAIAELHGPWAIALVWLAGLAALVAAAVRLRRPGTIVGATTIAGLVYFAGWVMLPSFRYGTAVYWLCLLGAVAAGVIRDPTDPNDPTPGDPGCGSGGLRAEGVEGQMLRR